MNLGLLAWKHRHLPCEVGQLAGTRADTEVTHHPER